MDELLEISEEEGRVVEFEIVRPEQADKRAKLESKIRVGFRCFFIKKSSIN